MPKGFNTQVVAILLQNPLTLDEIREVLWDFEKSDNTPGTEDPASWAIGSEGFTIHYDGPKRPGAVLLDIVSKPWPDDMGDMETQAMTFMAWSMGQFGPGAFPGSLERAGQQSWSWEDAQETIQQHTAFIRLRLTYMVGQEEEPSGNTPLFPEGYDGNDAIEELNFLDQIAINLLNLPTALCYFNPSGEVALPLDLCLERATQAEEANIPNLASWINIRLYRIDETWFFMDSVGNTQIEIPDMEVVVPNASNETLGNVDSFIRNISMYILQNPDAIQDGHTADGPEGTILRAHFFENSLVSPPRAVILWLPPDMDPLSLPEGFPEREIPTDEPDSQTDSDQDDQNKQRP